MANRSVMTLACGECKQRNYSFARNKKGKQYKVEANKYCRFCKRHTAHKEGKT